MKSVLKHIDNTFPGLNEAPPRSAQLRVHGLITTLRFLGLLLWAVLRLGCPRKAHGWPQGSSRGPPGHPGARAKNYKNPYCLGRTYGGGISDFSFWGVAQKMVTKWPWNRSLGLICVDLCSVFQAGAVGTGPGPNFG